MFDTLLYRGTNETAQRNSALSPSWILPADCDCASAKHGEKGSKFLGSSEENGEQLIQQGKYTFRFDTYGDEAFWTGQLQIQQAVCSLTPLNALALGLKVDADALSPSVVEAIKHDQVNLNDPAVTLQLIKQNAVLGVVGTFNGNTLSKVGFTCALCHSTVDNSVALGSASESTDWGTAI